MINQIESDAHRVLINFKLALLELRTSPLNPENEIKRRAYLDKALADIARDSTIYSIIHRTGVFDLYCSYATALYDMQAIEPSYLNNLTGDLIALIDSEIGFQQECFARVEPIQQHLYVPYLKDLYFLRLKLYTKLYQRPSSQYGDLFRQTAENLERLISDISCAI